MGFQFVDEPLNVRKLLGDAFDFSASELIVLNACWMGAMRHSGYSHEITAFNTVLTMRGASRITSALWAVDDGMAVAFARAYAHALHERCFGPVDVSQLKSPLAERLRHFQIWLLDKKGADVSRQKMRGILRLFDSRSSSGVVSSIFRKTR